MSTRDLPEQLVESLDDSVFYPFFAVELLFDGDETLRLWTGVGTLVFQGLSWFGTGSLLQIDSVEETSEISAKGASVTFSGVPSEVLSLALSEPYQGRKANIYFGNFTGAKLLQENSSYILLQDGSKIELSSKQSPTLIEIFSGYMDQMTIEETGQTSTVELTIENKLVDLERARVARFTSEHQKSIYPQDRGLDFIEGLQDKDIVWGRKVKGSSSSSPPPPRNTSTGR
tara:strand:+ start:399 stop:1085 length:687 start_codon:yes stop_codon:yes gene_type:complete